MMSILTRSTPDRLLWQAPHGLDTLVQRQAGLQPLLRDAIGRSDAPIAVPVAGATGPRDAMQRLADELALQLHAELNVLYPLLREHQVRAPAVDEVDVLTGNLLALVERLRQDGNDAPLSEARLTVVTRLLRLLRRWQSPLLSSLRQAMSAGSGEQLHQALLEAWGRGQPGLAAGEPLEDDEEADPVGEPPR